MAQAEHLQSWSDLPTEIAGLVLRRLPAYSDRVRFGAVCRHWSFSSAQIRLPPPLPCLVFPDGTFLSFPNYEFLQFNDSANYHSSSGERLVFSCDGTCSLKNPFSNVTLTLPNLSCHCIIDEPVEIVNGRFIPEGVAHESLNMDAEMSIDKVVVCSSLLVAAIVDIGRLNTVALCQPGAASWFVSGLGCKRLLLDMVFNEGKLHVIDDFNDLLAIDVEEDNDSDKLSVSRIECLIESGSFDITLVPNCLSEIRQFLIACPGALLLINRTIFGRPSDSNRDSMPMEPVGIEFEVFEADFNSSHWVDVKSALEDFVLFLGRSYSQPVCVSPYELKGDMLKGNRILILDDGTCKWFWKFMPGSYAMYNMSDGQIYSLKLSELLKCKEAAGTWLFPQ